MTLIELFDSLEIPDTSEIKRFNALKIPEYPRFRLAIDDYSYPVLLLSVSDIKKTETPRNFRLRYVELVHGLECRVSEDNRTRIETFTVLTFLSTDRTLQEYFLRISSVLIESLDARPTDSEIYRSLTSLVEVLRALTDSPSKSIQGLWAELFFIDIATEPAILINYWHSFPEEKFDFNSGVDRVEVKSNGNFERIHHFSSEQLNPPKGTNAVVASVFIRPNSAGRNIQDLLDSITAKVRGEVELINKLYSLTVKTLGSAFEQSHRWKFDYQIAADSLRFYRHSDIKRIASATIPNEVSEVKYKSDLTKVDPVGVKELGDGNLYRAI